MNDLIRIPCVLMRGGTSKGPFFLARDLPLDPAHQRRQFLAHRRRRHMPRGPLEQRRPDCPFKFLNAPTQRGLRKVQRLRRPMKALQLHHQKKGPEIEDLAIHAYHASVPSI